MTTDELIAYYSNLLIMQYANKPRAIATIDAYVGESIADQIIQQVSDGFNLDNAIGNQLTMLGTYRNAPRVIFGLTLDKEFFSMPEYDDPSPDLKKGFTDYDNPNPSWYFLLYTDVNNLIYTLTDNELRTLIRYLAEVNSSQFGLGALDNILFEFFGNFVTLTDNGDMTITYHNDPANPDDLFAIVNALGALPRPSGVEVIVT